VKVPFVAELMKLMPRSALQDQVVALGVCARCHTKTLMEAHPEDPGRWVRCSKCRALYVTNRAGANPGL